ncbi:MAG: UDP-2,3-diacylglucosamine pyrophosphatase LpxH [Marinoscillum sp.]
MKIKNKIVYQKLDELYEEAKPIALTESSKWVIFSDLHMGDGGSNDDFKANAPMLQSVLSDYYLKQDFGLILNGDVEELQRFKLKNIRQYWKSVFDLFDQFQSKIGLHKTVGNHDLDFEQMNAEEAKYTHPPSLRLDYKGNSIFIFHGHQASRKFQKHNQLIGLTLKYFANPLGIKNYSVSHSSQKQYNIEKRVYHYSAYRKIVSIIGHTHRPLFESLHKVERLRYKIEQLCREFATGLTKDPQEVLDAISTNKSDLRKYYKQALKTNFQNYVYNTIFHIPCLFNSGCVIGKRGMTCIELDGNMIRLVHWFDGSLNQKYLSQSGYNPEQLAGTDIYRMVINEETLDYIFTRIKLLS